MTKEELREIYQELLMREPDDGSEDYLNFDREFVVERIMLSKERQSIESLVNFFRKFGVLKGK